jgi:hypothetical protein
MSIIPALRRQRQKDLEFKASLGYKVRSCLKNNHEVEDNEWGIILIRISMFPVASYRKCSPVWFEKWLNEVESPKVD